MNTLSNEEVLNISARLNKFIFDNEIPLSDQLGRIIDDVFNTTGELLALRKEREEAVPVRYMNRYTGACYTLEQQPDAATDTAVYVPLFDIAQPVAVPDIGQIRVGRLPTMNQDDYPGLGDWCVQLRIGEDSEEVLARVYGATPQEANNRAEALACRAAMLNQAPVKQPASNEGQP